jgi:pilus assembly protein FimV
LDKNKVIEAAAKLVAKGAYDKAIKEYQKILDVDPKDVRILQKMGELYQKKNDNSQAAAYFTQVAESYTSDGFFLKAVALYKQVLKLDPSLLDINIKLAELHQQLQLFGEAMAYYQIVANHYDKAGATRKSLDVLKKMVDLDPENVASRVKLADLYVREGMNSEAAAEFTRAAEHLKRNNRVDDYLRVAERLSALDPDNHQLAKELAEMYLTRNDQKRALAKLQVCFKADNRDIDTLRLLAVAFQGLGQTSKTISVYKEMARAYEDRGQSSEAEQVWAQVAQLDPHDPDVAARTSDPAASEPESADAYGVDEAELHVDEPAAAPPLSRQPASSAAPQSYPPLPSAPPPLRPRGDTIAKLLTETDVYVKYGLHDKALEHLRKVFAVEPENIDAHEKAYAIYVASNNHAQAFEQLLNVLRLHTRSGDAPRAQPFLASILQQNPSHPEVPVFVSALQLEAQPVGDEDGQLEGVSDDAILVDSSEDEIVVAEEPQEEVISAEVSFSGPMDADGEGGEQADEPGYAGDLALEAAAAASDSPLADEELHDEPLWQPAEGPGVTDAEPPAGGDFVLGDDQADTGSMPAMASTQLAERRIDEPGSFDEPTRLTPLLDPVAFGAAPGSSDQTFVQSTLDEPTELPPEDEPAAEEIEEAAFFLDQGLHDEAREILETVLIAYPEHARAAAMLASMDAPPAQAEEAPPLAHEETHDAFDLAAELASELGELEVESPGFDAAPADDYQVSVEEVFAEFKKGLEKVVKPEDVDTHYDLGVAYKEMGLVDDAVTEFAVARKGCVGKRKELDCLSMIGLLHQIRGDYAGSVEAFIQALATEHATGEVEKAIRYDLAAAYEGLGQAGRALGQYLKVRRVDPVFRDVSAHVGRLEMITAPEDDDAPGGRSSSGKGSSGARKVGYI